MLTKKMIFMMFSRAGHNNVICPELLASAVGCLSGRGTSNLVWESVDDLESNCSEAVNLRDIVLRAVAYSPTASTN